MNGKFTIDNVPVKLAMRTHQNGGYLLFFEHDVTLDQLERINWANPTIVKAEPVRPYDTYLPYGYGFELEKLTYSSLPKEWQAEIKVCKQYLGDVTEYQEKIDKLTAQSADQKSTISNQKQEIAKLEVQLAEADELAIALYEAQIASEESKEVTE